MLKTLNEYGVEVFVPTTHEEKRELMGKVGVLLKEANHGDVDRPLRCTGFGVGGCAIAQSGRAQYRDGKLALEQVVRVDVFLRTDGTLFWPEWSLVELGIRN